MAKKGMNYFDAFIQGVEFGCQAAALLRDCFAQYDPEQLPQRMEEMHRIEHAADEMKHGMMQSLLREFLPPIEREDIMELANTIDDVTDSIEDVLLRLYMFNITRLRPDVQAFAEVIVRLCAALKQMAGEMHNFRRSTQIRELVIEINHLEEEGDRLYSKAVRQLYAGQEDPVAVMAWTTLYDHLEKCCDRCEDVADVAERVIMKNT
ncbi:MAG TPA: DUF47 family protein [Firmicutes bacterium]|nr:DUF47 family protein [Bacillota bacterium]